MKQQQDQKVVQDSKTNDTPISTAVISATDDSQNQVKASEIVVVAENKTTSTQKQATPANDDFEISLFAFLLGALMTIFIILVPFYGFNLRFKPTQQS